MLWKSNTLIQMQSIAKKNDTARCYEIQKLMMTMMMTITKIDKPPKSLIFRFCFSQSSLLGVSLATTVRQEMVAPSLLPLLFHNVQVPTSQACQALPTPFPCLATKHHVRGTSGGYSSFSKLAKILGIPSWNLSFQKKVDFLLFLPYFLPLSFLLLSTTPWTHSILSILTI